MSTRSDILSHLPVAHFELGAVYNHIVIAGQDHKIMNSLVFPWIVGAFPLPNNDRNHPGNLEENLRCIAWLPMSKDLLDIPGKVWVSWERSLDDPRCRPRCNASTVENDITEDLHARVQEGRTPRN